MGLSPRVCQVETAGGGETLSLLSLPVLTTMDVLSGWPVLFAAYEVGSASVLRYPAYVRHPKVFFLLLLTFLVVGPHSPL